MNRPRIGVTTSLNITESGAREQRLDLAELARAVDAFSTAIDALRRDAQQHQRAGGALRQRVAAALSEID